MNGRCDNCDKPYPDNGDGTVTFYEFHSTGCEQVNLCGECLGKAKGEIQ